MGQSAVKMNFVQPEHFEFTAENLKEAQKIIAKYPKGFQQSAVMPLLRLAQQQHDNWLPRVAIEYVANMLGMPVIRVYEVASFYTMYNLAPVGRHVIEVCTTTPCWLRGSEEIVKACEEQLGIHLGETTPDDMFTLREVECLGACVNAPMACIGDRFFEDLNARSMTDIIKQLRRGETPQPGPQNGRQTSAPAGGPTTLTQLSFAKGDAASAEPKKAPAARKPRKGSEE